MGVVGACVVGDNGLLSRGILRGASNVCLAIFNTLFVSVYIVPRDVGFYTTRNLYVFGVEGLFLGSLCVSNLVGVGANHS